MTSKNGKKYLFKDSPWHLLFFAIYPVLALFANNISQVAPGVEWKPLLFSVVSAGILLVLFWVVFRNWQRAALLAVLILVLFFSYGQVYGLLKNVQVLGVLLFRHRTLIPLWILLAGLGTWLISRGIRNLTNVTRILNIIGLCLLVYPCISISGYLWQEQTALKATPTSSGLVEENPSTTNHPDVYYIILDSYTRADIYEKTFHFDNSAFLNSLKKMGFYIADCSQSNYSQTELSLASSLNYNYLDVLTSGVPSTVSLLSAMRPIIKHSELRQFLESQGYKVVAFETGFSWTELNDADIYLTPRSSGWALMEFDYLLLRTTAVRVLLDVPNSKVTDDFYSISRLRATSALSQLEAMPSVKGPKFVFAHITVPHLPFVFGPHGEVVTPLSDDMTNDEYIRGYTDQTIYINGRIKQIVAEIIARSATPPIIIIQGDHGAPRPKGADRMPILNAYYLPGVNPPLYKSITPVNTFRIVLNAYFGQNLPLLPDISRYSTPQAKTTYTEIPNQCPTK